MKDNLTFHMDNDNHLRQAKIAFNSLPIEQQTEAEFMKLLEDKQHRHEVLKPLLPANFDHAKKSLKINKREYGSKDQ